MPRDRMTKKVHFIAKVALVTIFAFIFIAPFILVFINSVKTQGEVVKNPFSLPSSYQFNNFSKAWKAISFGKILVNTLVVTVVGSLLLVYFSAKVAYWCERHPTKISRIYEACLICSILIPFSSIMLSIVKMLSGVGLTGTLWGGIITYLGMGMAFSYFIMRGGAKSIPKELEEAAMIDGCNTYGVFFKIVFPLMTPTAISVLILQAFWIWNDYNIAIILLNTRRTRTIQVAIHALFAQNYSKWDIALPALVMGMIPIMIISILLQKKIFSGMTAGAVKG